MPQRGHKSAARFVEQHGWPVVIKPLKGSGGRGVTANIASDDQLKLAIQEIDSPNGFLIEKHVPGEDYRFLVLKDEVIGVWRRDAANVIGDGRSSIDRLIDRKNDLTTRSPLGTSRLVKKDNLLRNHLASIGKSLDDVPAAGEKVYLRSAANLSAGGDNIEVTDETHKSIKELAVRAKQVLPTMELVGIDILMDDHRFPADQQSVNICEINSSPGIASHSFPTYGPPRPVAKLYVEHNAAALGAKLSEYRAEGRYRFSARGTFPGSSYQSHLKEAARTVDVRIIDIDSTLERAVVTFEGDARAAAVFDCLAISPRAQVGRVESTTLEIVG
ncbi:hypothetical protein [Microbacterium sp. NIBRBAC000506063]|uniref:hypothetical protein n=1 Tax=Microbacterium sp. NIBRBAC000506063 TaxID=2734618 RepID=UPI001BB7241D|nr:hypothetical protein [Microbacterium sp. NIBRBAC000506063]QTV80749.1 hypothetical protein KAE78_06895 [Microbacterium sp. NIBRBAC000506063]